MTAKPEPESHSEEDPKPPPERTPSPLWRWVQAKWERVTKRAKWLLHSVRGCPGADLTVHKLNPRDARLFDMNRKPEEMLLCRCGRDWYR